MDLTHYKLNGTSLFGLCTKKKITLPQGIHSKKNKQETLYKATYLGIKLFSILGKFK